LSDEIVINLQGTQELKSTIKKRGSSMIANFIFFSFFLTIQS